MKHVASYSGVAFNEVPESENEIHGDDVAARFGFEGGLVPGVTVSAYLAHPAVAAWGMDYVARGAATIVIDQPVYDGRAFTVSVAPDGDGAYAATLANESGSVRARGRCWLPRELPVAPVRRGDPLLEAANKRPRGTPDIMRRMQQSGMGALLVRWDDGAEITRYFRDSEQMPAPLNPAAGGYAHLGFLLGLSNWALASNVLITPWLHLQTDSQCFEAIALGTELVVESAIADLFEKKGHHFCDVDVVAYRASDNAPVIQTRLRAIYQLRGL